MCAVSEAWRWVYKLLLYFLHTFSFIHPCSFIPFFFKMWFYKQTLTINKGKERARKTFWVSSLVSFVYSLVYKVILGTIKNTTKKCFLPWGGWHAKEHRMGLHISLFNFCVSPLLFFFWWQGCGSFRKWNCPSAFYKTSEVIFPLWTILGRENGNEREEDAFFKVVSHEWQSCCLWWTGMFL